MTWKIGEYVFILSLMSFAKIVSVRKAGNITTLWVKHKDIEFPMSTMGNSNVFTFKGKGKHQSIDSDVYKVGSMITGLGLILAAAIGLYFFG